FISLIFSKESMIYKYACQLFSDCLRKQSCCYRRIYSAGKCQKNFSVSYFFLNRCNGMFHEGIHSPVTNTSADILYEVVDHLRSFLRMQYFRMELDCI